MTIVFGVAAISGGGEHESGTALFISFLLKCKQLPATELEGHSEGGTVCFDSFLLVIRTSAHFWATVLGSALSFGAFLPKILAKPLLWPPCAAATCHRGKLR